MTAGATTEPGSWRGPAVFLAAAAVGAATMLYAPDSDGAFAIYDGVWYGHFAEDHAAYSILPHHPLFHMLVVAATEALRWAGIAAPGHVAARAVAGVGAALVMLQIARLSGRGRAWVGFAFAFALFATRGFITEAATGENLLPAFAAALLVFDCATAASPGLVRLGAAIALAVCFRQDNLFLLPGALLAVAPALPKGSRIKPLAVMLAVAGAVTIAVYLTAWAWVRTVANEDFLTYLTRFGHTARWSGPASVETNLLLHFGSLGAAIFGRFWFEPMPHIGLAAAWVGAIAVAGRLLRGADGSRRYTVAAITTIAIRMPFYAWFEPQNFEWQLLAMTLLVALCARGSRGAPVNPLSANRAGLALLIIAGVAVLAAHAPNTWTLRQRRLAEAIDEVIAIAGPRAYFLPLDKNTMIALELRRREYYWKNDMPYGVSVESLARFALEKAGEVGRPVVLVGDRFVESGMPWDLAQAGNGLRAFDEAPATRGVTIVRREDKPFAAILPPP